MTIKRDRIKQTLSYGWIVFLCSACGITGIAIGWGVHRAIVNITGQNLGMIQLTVKVIDNFDNPYAFVGAIVSIGGLILQFIRTFKSKREQD